MIIDISAKGVVFRVTGSFTRAHIRMPPGTVLLGAGGMPLSVMNQLPNGAWVYAVDIPEMSPKYHATIKTDKGKALKVVIYLRSDQTGAQAAVRRGATKLACIVPRPNVRQETLPAKSGTVWDLIGGDD